MKNKILLTSLFVSSLMGSEISELEQEIKDLENKLEKHDGVGNKKGRLFNNVSVDLNLGIDIMYLQLSTSVTDPDIRDSSGKKINLADGGEYKFDSIITQSKKATLSLFDYTFSYENITNKDNNTKYDNENIISENTDPSDDKLIADINEIIAGFGIINTTNSFLNYLSVHQLIKREAKFYGNYTRGNFQENFKLDKTKYAYRYLSAKSGKTNNEGVKGWAYIQIEYENNTAPQIVFDDEQSLDFIDPEFKSTKYIGTFGGSALYPNGQIIGMKIGLGWSSVKLSEYAKNKIIEENLDPDIYALDGGLNIVFGFDYGFQKKYTFSKTEIELNAIYGLEYISEKMKKVEREELLHTARLNAIWRF